MKANRTSHYPEPVEGCQHKRRVDWKASWIWHEDDPKQKNIYVHFRKAFQAERGPDNAVVHITADTEYVLWVNGTQVGRGPLLSDPRWQPYDTYDIGQFLQAGENVIAVLCYYYGEGLEDDSWRRFRTYEPLNMKRASHDSRPGLLCQVEMSLGDEQVRVVSDASWRSLKSECWLCDVAKIDDQTYSEIYDAQREPGRWQQPDYDDGAWTFAGRSASSAIPAFVQWDGVKVLGGPRIFPWIMLEPRDLPHLVHRELPPATVMSTGEVIGTDYEMGATALQMTVEHILPSRFTTIRNLESLCSGGLAQVIPFDQDTTYEDFLGVRSATVILDMGDLINGRLEIDLEGPVGGRVDIAYGQRLLENGKPEIYSSRICSADTYLTKAGRQQWTSFGWRHFRYVQLTFRDLSAPLTIHEIKAIADEYPAEQIGSFKCSDDTLNWAWNASVKAARLCTYDRFMDCANRERRQHSEHNLALCTMSAFGNTAVLRRFFRAFLRGQTMYGFIPNAAPSEYENAPIIGASTMLMSAVLTHYALFADKPLLTEAYEAMVRYIRFMENFRGDDGLIGDHPMMVWQDDPEVDGAEKGKVLTVNALYAQDLELTARMAREFGNSGPANGFERKSSETRNAINEKFWDEERGAFVDYISQEDIRGGHISEHGNYMMMFFGYVREERSEKIVSALKDPDTSIGQASPAFMNYPLEGLCRYGYTDQAMGIARHRYKRFIREGYDTIAELWNIRGSRSHAGTWQAFGSRAIAHCAGTGAAYWLVKDALGVRPLTPGCDEIEIAPHPGDLQWAEGSVPTGKGVVRVSWRVADGKFTLDCNLPEGMRATVKLSSGAAADSETWVTGTARVEQEFAG